MLLNWRDTGHPQGGGSERYVEHVAHGLAARGHRVTVCCSAYDGAAPDEIVGGVRFHRRGNDLTVYLWALLFVVRARPDLVVDVQNGLPFLSPLLGRRPVVVLVHHLHREQWRIVFGDVVGRIGWWIESWLAPRVYRRCRYVTVSNATAAGLVDLGVVPSAIRVVHNGLDPAPATAAVTDPEPLLVAVSRLTPHKRLEHAIDTVARLRERWPTLRLEIVGSGPWEQQLRDHVEASGMTDAVRLHGHLDEDAKHAVLARAWTHVCPSVKEGWGIVVMEAAAHGVPTVAYRSAGGVVESVVDGATGLLADDSVDAFAAHVETLLADRELRQRMRRACVLHSTRYTWSATVDAFEDIVLEQTGRPRVRAVPEPHVDGTAGTGQARVAGF